MLALGSAAGYAALALGSSFASLLALTSLLVLLLHAARAHRGRGHRSRCAPEVDVRAFGFYRAWGTIGYGVLVVGFPFLLDWLDPVARRAGGARCALGARARARCSRRPRR